MKRNRLNLLLHERKKPLFYRKIKKKKAKRLTPIISRNRNLIKEMFVLDDDALETILPTGEGINLGILFGLFTRMYEQNFPKIGVAIGTAFGEGGKRIFDRKGNLVKGIEPAKDDKAVDALLQRQAPAIQNMRESTMKDVRGMIAQGVEEGVPTREIRDNLAEQIPRTIDWKAERIARSEIISAHSEGMSQTLEENGIDKYAWITAKDDRVCPICKYLHGRTFKNSAPKTNVMPRNIKELKELVKAGYALRPVTNTHPNCRDVMVADL